MKKYNCLSCDYHTNLKGDYTRHLQTKKHGNVIQSYPNNNSPSIKQHECKYCGKVYKYRSGLSKHIKYTCKKNKDEDFQELARTGSIFLISKCVFYFAVALRLHA